MTEHAFSRQATKADLVDIALALDIEPLPAALERMTVPALRAAIRRRLELRPAEQQVLVAVLALIRREQGSPDADLLQAILDAGNRLVLARRAAGYPRSVRERSTPTSTLTEYVVVGDDTLPADTVEQLDAAARALAEAGIASAPVYVSPHPLAWIRENGDPDAVKTDLILCAAQPGEAGSRISRSR